MNEEGQLQVSATKVLVGVQENKDALPLKYVTYYRRISHSLLHFIRAKQRRESLMQVHVIDLQDAKLRDR